MPCSSPTGLKGDFDRIVRDAYSSYSKSQAGVMSASRQQGDLQGDLAWALTTAGFSSKVQGEREPTLEITARFGRGNDRLCEERVPWSFIRRKHQPQNAFLMTYPHDRSEAEAVSCGLAATIRSYLSHTTATTFLRSPPFGNAASLPSPATLDQKPNGRRIPLGDDPCHKHSPDQSVPTIPFWVILAAESAKQRCRPAPGIQEGKGGRAEA